MRRKCPGLDSNWQPINLQMNALCLSAYIYTPLKWSWHMYQYIEFSSFCDNLGKDNFSAIPKLHFSRRNETASHTQYYMIILLPFPAFTSRGRWKETHSRPLPLWWHWNRLVVLTWATIISTCIFDRHFEFLTIVLLRKHNAWGTLLKRSFSFAQQICLAR